MELDAGSKLGRYEVRERLGSGGMGQVWKARDTRLEREVAVKIISQDKAEDSNLRARFEREAKTLSALRHPNIVCVYDVGEEGTTQYIVSELVEGEPLRQLMYAGPVPFDRLIQIATQIASGLAAAHAAGIIHRDLKPENIMVTPEGVVKILDFGLARHVKPPAPAAGETVTQSLTTEPGMVLGTAGYMSPEQICGEEVDARTDIFSAGVVLYEMASGSRAFRGRNSIEMMSAILKDEPPRLPTKSPEGLDSVIRCCLEKDPAKRYPSAAEWKSALEALNAGGRRSTRGRWIGLAAAAAVALVAAGVYWQTGRKPSPPAREIIKTSQVSPAAAAAAPPAIPAAPPPAVKGDPPVLVKPKSSPPVKSPTRDTAKESAYQQAYEEGMLALSQRNWADASGRLTEAIRLKPDSGLAYLGRCHAAMGLQGYEKAISDCGEVIQRLPNSADAFHERGTAYLLTEQFDKAVADLNSAIRLKDTNLALAYNLRGRAHSGLKEWGDAIQDFDEAIRLNPKAAHFYVFRGIALNARSQFRKAIDDFDEALRLQPNLPMAYTQRALAKQRTGDRDGAASDREKAKGLRK